MLINPDLFSSHAGRIKYEMKELMQADELQFGKRSVIITPGQGFLQVHETIGHPLELDRILGYELSFAGGSFVNLNSFGKLRYGSEKLSVSAGGDFANSPGSFGFDDEGCVPHEASELEDVVVELVNADVLFSAPLPTSFVVSRKLLPGTYRPSSPSVS